MQASRVLELVHGKRNLVSVSASEKVSVVLELLFTERISCVAVYGQPHHWLGAGSVEIIVQGRQYVGLVSIVDILYYIFRGEVLEERLNNPVVQAIGSTRESMTLVLEPFSRPIALAMEQFCKGTHYALAVDDQSGAAVVQEPKMLSQTDVVSFLLDNAYKSPQLSSIMAMPVSQFATPDTRVVYHDTPLVDVLGLLLAVRAVPIIERESGRLAACMSTSDFRGLNAAGLEAIIPMTVYQFLLHVHRGAIPPVMTINSDGTLQQAIVQLLASKRHRIWVCNSGFSSPFASGGLQVGVLSLTDIIRALYRPELVI